MLFRILCSNRDEYFDRSTKTAHWHNFGKMTPNLTEPTVLSGIDVVANGTWLGINKSGNIALLQVAAFSHRLSFEVIMCVEPISRSPIVMCRRREVICVLRFCFIPDMVRK